MIDTRKISELHEWDKNPRSITEQDFERLKRQIQRLGQYKPVIITEDGEVIGGNMRLKAYRELGIEDVWVSVVHPKDENEKLEFALSDNDRAGFYNEDLLKELTDQYTDFNWSEYAIDLKQPQTIDSLLEKSEKSEDELLNYESQFQIVVECKNEIEQQEIYQKLVNMGLICKVLSL